MPYPTISDDGSALTLDLHGATTAEAEKIVRSLLPIASARGRKTLRIVHGTSTSELDPYRRTIKNSLPDILEAGRLDDYVNDYFTFEGHTTVGVRSSGAASTKRIVLSDLL